MRIIISDILLEWEERLKTLDADNFESASDDDYFFDRQLYGAALLVKEIAFRTNDTELLGLSTKVELALKRRFDQEDRDFENYENSKARLFEAYEKIRRECIKYFYDEPIFSVDLSKYSALIEANKATVSEATLAGLERYLDAKKVFSKVYVATRNALQHKFASENMVYVPQIHDIREEFERQLADFYRRADSTVPFRLGLTT